MRFIIIILFFNCWFSSALYGQSGVTIVQKFTYYNVANDNSVVMIKKDINGFLWTTGTFTVRKFDGTNIQSFQFSKPIQKIYIDKCNRKFVITIDTVFLFDSLKQQFQPFLSLPIGKSKFLNFFQTTDSLHFLAVTPETIFTVSTANKTKKMQPLRLGKTNLIFSDGGSFNDSLLVIGSSQQLLIYHFQKQQFITLKIPFVQQIHLLNNKYILTSSSRFQNHLIQLLPNKIILTANFLNNQYSKAAVPLSDSNNLIITSNGAYVFNAKNGSTSPHQFSYNGHQMKGLNGCTYAEADEGYNIYFNSYSGLYFSQKQVTTQWLRQYAITNNFENDFRGFATNNNGKIWMASTQGIYENTINPISGEFETFPGKKLPIDYPSFRYLIYHKNQLFIGSSGNGVFVWNTLSKKIKKAYLADSYSIKEKTAFDSAYIWKMAYYDSAHLLIAAGNGLYLLHMQQLVAKKINAQLASGNSRSLFINYDSVIWHGSVSGLTLLSKEFKIICTIANPFPDKRIGDIASISKHKALIGTTGLYEVAYNFGKNTYSAKRLTIFPNNVFVYTITKDAENKFWLGTNNGIYCYDYFLQKIWHFSSNDNIQQAPFNSNGSLTLQNNILLFGGRDGVQIIHPTALLNHASTEKPVKPFIETLKAGKIQHTIAPNCSIQLPYTQRQIEFSIQCNELFQPDIVKYRYVINGKTSEIVPSHNNILVSNLSYGTNILNTEASVNGNIWQKSNQSIVIFIEKPWWLQPWFWLVALATLAGSVYLLKHQIYKKQLLKQQKTAIDYFSKVSYAHLCVDEILWDIAFHCVKFFRQEDCVIYLVDKTQKCLFQKAAFGNKLGDDKAIINPLTIPFGKGITGHVYETKKGVIINNTHKNNRYIIDDAKRLSELTVPIIFENEVIGVIDCEHSRKNFFHAIHLESFTIIANFCASYIAHALAKETLEANKKQLLVLENTLRDLKLKNLRLQMNPHFLFNTLNAIQLAILKENKLAAYEQLNVFSNFLRNLLLYSDKTGISLEEEINLLKMFVSLEAIGVGESINFSIQNKVAEEADDILLTPFLIQPFIENAIWHGLKNKEGDKYIAISFSTNNNYLICEITDNGIGLTAAQKQTKNISLHTGKATAIVKERLQLLKNDDNQSGYLTINEWYLPNNQVGGTKVILYIPY